MKRKAPTTSGAFVSGRADGVFPNAGSKSVVAIGVIDVAGIQLPDGIGIGIGVAVGLGVDTGVETGVGNGVGTGVATGVGAGVGVGRPFALFALLDFRDISFI
jgi:hypothetical protein